MKNFKRFNFALTALFPMAFFLMISSAEASSLTQPIESMKLPGKGWEYQPPTKKDGTQKIMNPVKTGQAVNVRIHTYGVPISAKAFAEEVRLKISKKPDYEGAQIDLLSTKTVKGKTWDVFSIRRKDEINQEIWARKTSNDVVLMIIYTGAGGYYQQYHNDLMELVKQAS